MTDKLTDILVESPVDIEVLASKVEGFDAGNYYDEHGQAVIAATRRWPFLVRLVTGTANAS
jgi:hypothetical protein